MTCSPIDNAYAVLDACKYDSMTYIKKLYKQKAMQYHPDRTTTTTTPVDECAAGSFIDINNAYELLKKYHIQHVRPSLHVSIPFNLKQSLLGDIIDVMYNDQVVSITMHEGTTDNEHVQYVTRKVKVMATFIQLPSDGRHYRVGDDCVIVVDIPVKTAMIGGDIWFTDLTNTTHQVHIIAGTQPFTRIRLQHTEGFYNKKSCTYGSIVVICNVVVPAVYDIDTTVGSL